MVPSFVKERARTYRKKAQSSILSLNNRSPGPCNSLVMELGGDIRGSVLCHNGLSTLRLLSHTENSVYVKEHVLELDTEN